MKRSDIPDGHVLELAAAWLRAPFEAPPVWDALVAEGIPSKLALAKINHLSDRGLLDWGVSPRCAWPTVKGEQLLRELP
ncbi:hypothetical protein AB0O28_18955 [Microbispora sp. NPDC088329]|uniref:hypothetical protein n=1 Tax=Microbispora sp. NPDC088329 TaxID=3154869 RepID=UPI0034215ED9